MTPCGFEELVELLILLICGKEVDLQQRNRALETVV